MPGNRVISDEEVVQAGEGSKGNKEYKRQCERILGHFKTFLRETEKDERDLVDVVKCDEQFESLVKKSFSSV